MHVPRPRSLNGLILVGFTLVVLPLLVAVIWALVSLDRLAEQGERLVVTSESAAQNNQLLTERVGQMDRVAQQFTVLRDAELLQILREDLNRVKIRLQQMAMLTKEADAEDLALAIREEAEEIVRGLSKVDASDAELSAELRKFEPLRRRVDELIAILSLHVDNELNLLQESARDAQRISAWQVVALVPGTLILVVTFTLLVARPIRRIDQAITQLGDSGLSKPIHIKGPTDLERLGRQLDWLRQRLLELAQEKNKFLRHMSHELKTPLANIREGSDLLLDGSVGDLDKPQREVADIIRMNGLKLQQLIENLLSFSAWQTKTEVLTLTDFPLRPLVISVAKGQRLALKLGNIQLRLEVQDIIVNADREKIRTVLDNLLSNAIKFTPNGGLIAIRGVRTPSSFVLDFADTGPGIPPEESPRIFEAFFQGRREQTGPLAGTGIGLSVVMECVQAHDGSVELVDTDEFSGAHFRIHIPQKQVQATAPMVANG